MGQLDRNIPPRLKAALQAYLSRGTAIPLSISAAMRAMRGELPDLDIADEELATIIASAAVEAGASVVFDSRLPK
jgi:hypothetical protein